MQNSTIIDHNIISRESQIAVWIVSVLINTLGVILCIRSIHIIRLTRNTARKDIFVILLCCGCLMMSLPCAIECLKNLFNVYLYTDASDFMCKFGSQFHLIAITIQSSFVSLIAFRLWVSIVFDKKIQPNHTRF